MKSYTGDTMADINELTGFTKYYSNSESGFNCEPVWLSKISWNGNEASWKVGKIDLTWSADGKATESVQISEYRTNSRGCGLWILIESPNQWIQNKNGTKEPLYEWKQIVGTTQFNVDCSNARRRIRKHFGADIKAI